MAVLGVLGVLLEMGWNGRVRICMIEWWGTRKLILASEVGDLAKEKVTERFGSNWTIQCPGTAYSPQILRPFLGRMRSKIRFAALWKEAWLVENIKSEGIEITFMKSKCMTYVYPITYSEDSIQMTLENQKASYLSNVIDQFQEGCR